MAERTDLLMKGSDVTLAINFANHADWNIICDRVISFDAAPQFSTLQAQHLGNSSVTFGSSFGGWKGNATLHIPNQYLKDVEEWMVNRTRRLIDWEEVSLTVKYWDGFDETDANYIAEPRATSWSRTFRDIVFDSFSINSTARDGFCEFSFSFSCSDSSID
jgi:hypothetical protein